MTSMLEYIHNHSQESERLLGIKYEQLENFLKQAEQLHNKSNRSPEHSRSRRGESPMSTNGLQAISKMGVTLTLEPGDWLMVNNHIVYHARSSWKIESGEYERLLLRVCFSPLNSRELPNTDTFRSIWGSVEAGKPRGGFLPNHQLPPDQAISEPLSETESYCLERYMKVRWVGVEQKK